MGVCGIIYYQDNVRWYALRIFLGIKRFEKSLFMPLKRL